jgi:hypothetical protein
LAKNSSLQVTLSVEWDDSNDAEVSHNRNQIKSKDLAINYEEATS